jgi:hypothetical protein
VPPSGVGWIASAIVASPHRLVFSRDIPHLTRVTLPKGIASHPQ